MIHHIILRRKFYDVLLNGESKKDIVFWSNMIKMYGIKAAGKW